MDDHRCFADTDEYARHSPGRWAQPIHARRCYHGADGEHWEVRVGTLRDGRTSASVFGSDGDIYTHPEHCTPAEAVAHLNGLVDAERFPLDDELRDLMRASPIRLGQDDGATPRVAPQAADRHAIGAAPLSEVLFA